ncbi:PREDICTED: uncharacterized protein LOC109191620 [Ipomoea nil]|uniref:uncharacterized protein LOC109191620 n=1 Tax=Ipomoea nil TaxID=35883 RepID=UPI000901A30C|nr:PREDICTED: uncharacterized protein LOC109191620 [Ipomoea nil]
MGEQGTIKPSAVNRRSPQATENKGESRDDVSGGGRVHRPVGEFAGGTAAECAMVCCCCPCAVLDFLVLAFYRVPVGLCRKAWRRRKQKLLVMKRRKMEEGATTVPARTGSPAKSVAPIGDAEAVSRRPRAASSLDFEREMWGQFYGAGFWRSTSERDSLPSHSFSRF